jgi:hypothetical protein
MNPKQAGARTSRKMSFVIVSLVVTSSILTGLLAMRAFGFSAHATSIGNYQKDGIQGFNNLFGNFSSMTVRLTSGQGPSTSTSQYTYTVLGITSVQGMSAYEVNITGTVSGSGSGDTESLDAWVCLADGQILKTFDSEDGYLYGTRAEAENNAFSTFTTMYWLSMINSSTVSRASAPARSATLGQVNLKVATFNGLSSFAMLQDWTVNVGIVQSSGVALVTYSSFEFSGAPSTFQIISLTPA